MNKKLQKGIIALLPLFLLASCSKGDDVIQTVPATNNPNMIIDSNRSPFTQGFAMDSKNGKGLYDSSN